MSWNAIPTSAHGKPPKGNRPRTASASTHTPAVSHGDVTPRRASTATAAPAAATYAAIAATNGTNATTPKKRAHSSTTP